MIKKKKILFLESFYGGSHKDFADGLVSESQHKIELVTLPARFWKWRMRGAALYFFKKIKSFSEYDGLIVTDLMSLADLKALSGTAFPPSVVYLHENQLTYPTAPDESVDYQFGFTNLTTTLTAEKVIFNSHTHYNSFFSALPGFLNMMPEYHPKWAIKEIQDKSDVIYPGISYSDCRLKKKNKNIKKTPLIIWNHRWEFDKNPQDFFYALDRVSEKGFDFKIALLGENFQIKPKEFIAAKERYGDRIIVYGYAESKSDYAKWLSKGDVVISTAIQENFGISIVEAVRAGCIPFVPDRLSYPEIIPDDYHKDFLFTDRDNLVDKLIKLFSKTSDGIKEKVCELSRHMETFSWENSIKDYDEMLEELSSRSRNL
ncbi:MAG: DUF3524 domain-containing protein [Deltaproteobacteria bacterium]|nr:DUF3524 domain-containing protein [Deltaproteobacteria bacterium]